MARDRSRGRAAQRDAATQERIQTIFRNARAWYFRGVLALLVAVPLAFLSVVLAGALAAVALGCFVQGTRVGMEGELLRQGRDGLG